MPSVRSDEGSSCGPGSRGWQQGGRARLVGAPVDEAEARRDGELLERWRRSQGIAPEVIAQEAEEVRAGLLMKMK